MTSLPDSEDGAHTNRFFEARNNPKSAPLAAWFNGGPGCSSMIALFQENGPCHFVNGEKTPSLNEYSWNNDVNMVYIDQPIGVGFSYGNDQVSSTDTAAPYVWKFIQAFYAQFPEYESRDFGIFTESYGGHYGPGFASFIQEQNAAIKAGSVGGEPIELVALGINNGWYDSIIQQKAYIEFSYNNKYRQILNEQQRDNFTNAYNEKCLPALKQCPESGQDRACVNAVQTCNAEVEGPIMMGSDFNIYDIRHSSNDPYPPKTYQSYLQKPDVLNAIGARQRYSECSLQAGDYFDRTGDSKSRARKHRSMLTR